MSNAQECKCNGSKEISEEELLIKLDDVIGDYKGKPGALIPVLQIAQTLFGYLPEVVIKRVSAGLEEPLGKVFGVVTFYSFFSTVPRGKHMIRVCLGTACYVRNANDVLSALKKKLKIDIGQTTDDRLFSLDVGRCFGACGLAPVIMVDDDVFERVKPAKINDILNQYREVK